MSLPSVMPSAAQTAHQLGVGIHPVTSFRAGTATMAMNASVKVRLQLQDEPLRGVVQKPLLEETVASRLSQDDSQLCRAAEAACTKQQGA